jgi:hypothetical protein
MQVGPEPGDRLTIRQGASSVRVELRLAGRPAPAWFELAVRPVAKLASSMPQATWSMASGVALGCGGPEVFARTVDLLRHELAGRRKLPREVVEPHERRLLEELRPVGRAMARAASPRSREAALRFGAHARMWLYERFLADPTGRLVQASRVSPGVMLFSHALAEHGQPEVAARLVEGIVAGRRLDGLLDEALVAWERHGLAFGQDGGAFSYLAGLDEAERAQARLRQRWLIRHAAATVPSRLVWLPPPVAYAPEDVPRTARANARWFRRMKRRAFYPVEPGDEGPSAGLAAFLSARGEALEVALGPSDRWVRVLWALVQRERWELSRSSRVAPVRRRLEAQLDGPRAEAARLDVDDLPDLDELFDVDDLFGRGIGGLEADIASVPADQLFPEPPVPELCCEGMRFAPLRTRAALERESAEMRHCVRHYARTASSGALVFYALEGPQGRATLELMGLDDGWVVGQFRGPCNAQPGPEAFAALRAWVQESQRLLEARGSWLDAARALRPATPRVPTPGWDPEADIPF